MQNTDIRWCVDLCRRKRARRVSNVAIVMTDARERSYVGAPMFIQGLWPARSYHDRHFDQRLIIVRVGCGAHKRRYVTRHDPRSPHELCMYTASSHRVVDCNLRSCLQIMKMVKRLDEYGNPKIPCLLIGEPCALCKSKNEFICNHPSLDRMPYDVLDCCPLIHILSSHFLVDSGRARQSHLRCNFYMTATRNVL
jgi:hypothetical protein